MSYKSCKNDYDDYNDYGDLNKFRRKKQKSFKQFIIEGFTGDCKKYFIAGAAVAFCCMLALGGIGFLLGYNGALDNGFQRGYNEGHTEGYEDGLEEGQLDGYDIGYEEGSEVAQKDVKVSSVSGGTVVSNISEESTVYATESGSKYHKSDCNVIAGKDNLRSLTVDDAAAEGLTPCSKCFSD